MDVDRLDDRALLRAYVRRGDLPAFEAVVGRHQAALLRFACALVGDTHAAQDLVQDSFISLSQHAERVLRKQGRRGDGSVYPWLATVLRHTAIDRYRSEQRRREVGPADEAALAEPAVDEAREEPSDLWLAVDQLTPLQRGAVLLRYRDGASYQAIAAALGKSVSHVGVLLHEALARLRASPALREEVLP
ncbi:MAG: RNA polymerase sigma factor [Planctomycetota bacterium]|jgi:RNA polymerase sigma factor (sigma-70 family)|nr:RNA polymerase sigma factor [Planctomycetota bacterium]